MLKCCLCAKLGYQSNSQKLTYFLFLPQVKMSSSADLGDNMTVNMITDCYGRDFLEFKRSNGQYRDEYLRPRLEQMMIIIADIDIGETNSCKGIFTIRNISDGSREVSGGRRKEDRIIFTVANIKNLRAFLPLQTPNNTDNGGSSRFI